MFSQRGDGREQFATVANRGDAKAQEVFGRKLGQHLGIDVAVAERLLIASEPEAPKPGPDVQPPLPAGPLDFPWMGSLPRTYTKRDASPPGIGGGAGDRHDYLPEKTAALEA